MKPSAITLVCLDPLLLGTRLDKFLFSQFPEYSRTYFQELIDQGHVLVNNTASKSNYSIKKADQINVIFTIKQYNLAPQPVVFDVIDEQDDFIVINKPAGLLVHQATTASDEVSLVNGLLHRYQDLQKFDDAQRPGIVHRLDKNTSGLIIVARNQQAHQELCKLFKYRKISKTYLAVVDQIPPLTGKIDLPIGRHPIERHKMGTFGIDTKPALTHYKTLAQYADSALLAATIVTGRTHQIRVHFASQGHGLLGDATYGVASPLIKRQALHAWKMSFEYKEKQYSYICPVPADIRELLRQLSASKR